MFRGSDFAVTFTAFGLWLLQLLLLVAVYARLLPSLYPGHDLRFRDSIACEKKNDSLEEGAKKKKGHTKAFPCQ